MDTHAMADRKLDVMAIEHAMACSSANVTGSLFLGHAVSDDCENRLAVRSSTSSSG